MSGSGFLAIRNGRSCRRADIPLVPFDELRRRVSEACRDSAWLAALFAAPQPDKTLRAYAVLSLAPSGGLGILAAPLAESFPALTPECPQAHWFEREMAEQWGVRPEGHPWLKPLRFHRAYRPGRDAWGRPPEEPLPPGVGDFFHMGGEELHEVAVGPVHAGIIEPGHFRFQCHGERVFHLEISLGYQHRGLERALIGGPEARTWHLVETAAGDAAVGHALAYGQALEGLGGIHPPARANALRAIGLELERLANHTGDLGALSGDVGFLPTAAYCGRIRGDFLNLTALLCGSRFGRGLIRVGGVGFDADEDRLTDLARRLEAAMADLEGAVELLWKTPSVMGRFENTGSLSPKDALQLGLVGPAARACGVERDVRQDQPTGLYRFVSVPPATWPSGDVFARAFVRWLEIRRSAAFVAEHVRSLPQTAVRARPAPLQPDQAVVSLVEGWRGAICHVAFSDSAGRLDHYKIVDPSFHNWFGLALAMRDQQISDFPLCNKSFNLSYCGHDL